VVAAAPKGMIRVPGGTLLMGSERFYPEEAPIRPVEVQSFWMDEHPVTNAQYRRFVEATGYATLAESAPDAADYPGADPALLQPGSVVFQKPDGPTGLEDPHRWWAYVPGAWWRHPGGRGTTLHGLERHPVVHVAYEDALAYAAWAGKALPSEAEWEHAANGGREGAVFPWGDEFAPRGRMMANTWQGEFPWQNLLLDGHEATSPVRSFPPNGFGLYDVVGNVWEWTTELFALRPDESAPSPCCAPPEVALATGVDADHRQHEREIPRRTIKGGSHLCAPNYCLWYRASARQAEAVDTSTSHLGFRCVIRDRTAPTTPRG
jgi:formylglycine-generating enzyme